MMTVLNECYTCNTLKAIVGVFGCIFVYCVTLLIKEHVAALCHLFTLTVLSVEENKNNMLVRLQPLLVLRAPLSSEQYD